MTVEGSGNNGFLCHCPLFFAPPLLLAALSAIIGLMFIDGRRGLFLFLPLLLAALIGGMAAACTAPATPAGNDMAAIRTPAPADPTRPPIIPPVAPPPVALAPTPSPAPRPEPPVLPTPTATPAPVIPTATPIPPPAPSVPAFAVPPERDLYQLAQELLLPPGAPPVNPVVNPEPVSYAAGRTDDFWMVNLRDLEVYQSPFELRLVTPHAYWYVEEGLRVRQEDLARAAAAFEERIYPRIAAAFGTEWRPGVDNDVHLTILHGDISGAAGYFSSGDEYPAAVHPHSNEREMIYINGAVLPIGSTAHRIVLAHELQHAIHWNYDPSEATWVNEGLAELAVRAAGYQDNSMEWFMRHSHISLTHWPLDDANVSAHYGAAALFMHYLAEHYGLDNGGPGPNTLRALVAEPADDIAGIDAYLEQAGYPVGFYAVFRDWIAANFLDAKDGGIYGYGGLAVAVRERRVMNDFAELTGQAAQYGTDYIAIGPDLVGQPLRFRFAGRAENVLLPAEVGASGCWWSNAGDSIATTLTRTADLRTATTAALTYQVWHRIEKDWDYGYVQVSTDGGRHWEILETPHTSADNPIGSGFGPGYTGFSGGWIAESVDLRRYAGQEIQLRFQYVTDDALNDLGLCLRDIALTSDGAAVGSDADWQAAGFVRTDNRVPQRYIVQMLQKGTENRVTQLTLTADGQGGLTGAAVVTPYPGLKRMMVAITPIAPGTREPGAYTLTVEGAG